MSDTPTPVVRWVRSSHCKLDFCVEVARLPGATIGIRMSANPAVILEFTPAEWEAFLDGAKNGEFG